MAMFEKEGFCPCNSFENYGIYDKRKTHNVLSDRTLDILGDRTYYMVYGKNAFSNETYLVDMFLGGKSTLGLEVACVLRELIPEPGKKIVIYDLINACQIPIDCKTYEDDRYWVGIQEDGEDIKMYVYQK